MGNSGIYTIENNTFTSVIKDSADGKRKSDINGFNFKYK